MLPKCPTKYVDDPIGPPIYLHAAFRQHIFYYLHILDLQILFKSELETPHYQTKGPIFLCNTRECPYGVIQILHNA